MRFPPLRPAVCLSRNNRFTAMVREGERILAAHIPSSGRLRELIFPGNELWVADNNTKRGGATSATVYLARGGADLVCIHTGLSNSLAVEAWRNGLLAELSPYREVKREVAAGKSRIDLEFRDGERTCPAEVKCVTLVRDGLALFPDAPTGRGTKHLLHLAALASEGRRAAVIFMVQHPGGRRFAPNTAQDPEFDRALRQAAEAGVLVAVCRCEVGAEVIEARERIPVVW